MTSEPPPWYVKGEIHSSIINAYHSSGADTTKIVETLAEYEIDAPTDRIQTLVNSVKSERISQIKENSTAQTPNTTVRSNPARYIDTADISYLAPRDAAFTIGAALTRYEGSFRVPDNREQLAIDLIWDRQHRTVAFGIFTRETSDPVTEDELKRLAEGETSPASGRSPSVIGAIATSEFNTDARSLADENGIELFGASALTRWLQDAQLTPDVFGKILEDDLTPEEIMEIGSTLEPLPTAVADSDPLDPSPPTQNQLAENEDTAAKETSMPVDDSVAVTGQKGTLYADASDDGDYDGIDRFVDGLQGEHE